MQEEESRRLAKLLQPEIRQFIRENSHADTYSPELVNSAPDAVSFREVANQIHSLQQARKKIPDWYSVPGMVWPPPLSLEQCSSHATAKYKSSLLSGKRIADLTGGSGVDAFYLSNSFNTVHYVEPDSWLCTLAAHNFRVLQAGNIIVHCSRAEHFLQQEIYTEWMYIDPSRRNENRQKVYKLEDCTPDITSLLPDLFRRTDRVLLKAAPMLNLKQGLWALKQVSAAHIVAVNNEVKELLFELAPDSGSHFPVRVVNLSASGEIIHQFSGSRQDEMHATVPYGEPESYLYEPNAAMMKAGFFQLLGSTFAVTKLHPNTHLYTSHEIKEGFPGKIYRIKQLLPYRKKAVKEAIPGLRASVSVRNFPDKADSVKKKLGLKEDSKQVIFATTLQDGKPVLIRCERL